MTEATQEGATVAERLDDFLQQDAIPETHQAEPETEEEVSEDQVEEVQAEQVEQEATNEVETESKDEETETDVIEEAEDSLSLNDFASLLGVDTDKVDLDEDGSPVFKTKIDGVEGQVKINDLLKSHQLEGHLNNKNMEVVEARKALESERQEFNQTAQSKLQQLDGALNLASQQLYNEFNHIDWNALETQDPQTYIVTRQKFADRQAELQQSMTVLQQNQQQAQAQQQELLQQRIQEEKQSLFNKVPEWNTDEAWKKGSTELREGLSKTYGLEEEILNDIVDHRFVLIARDALKYKQLQESKPSQLNKVKKAPKVIKSSPLKAKPNQSDKVIKLKKQIKESGGKHGVAALLMEQGIV